MPLIVLEAFVKNPPRGMGKRFRAMKREALKEVAWFWHTNILERHFTPGNVSRYRMEARNRFYKEEIKKKQGEGQGRYVDLILKGRSLRWMKTFASVAGTATAATLRMKPPSYFTRPFIGTFTDPETGKQKRITRQPDKPAELKQVNSADRAAMVRFIRRGILNGWKTERMPSGRGSIGL